MGFLSDLGRSNAVQGLTNLLGKDEELGRLEVQGAQQNFQNTIGLMSAQAQMAEQARRQKEWDMNHEPIFLDDLATRSADKGQPNIGKWLAEQAQGSPLARQMKLPDGSTRPFVLRKDLKDVLASAKDSPEIAKGMIYARYLDASEGVFVAREQLAKEKDPVKHMAAETALKQKEDDLRQLKQVMVGMSGKEEDAAKPFTLSPGQVHFDATGKPIANVPPKPEEQWSEPYPMSVDGKTTQVQRNVQTGQVRPVASGTTVNVGIDTGLSKAATTKAQEEVQEGVDLYKGIENLVTISNPDYFTYAGQVKAGAQRIGEKAGVTKDTKFLEGFSGWKVAVEQEFNKYRKWATGVAAGEKELERLSNSFPNINMSKTQFMAASKQTYVNTWKLVERRRRALAAGIMDTKKQKDFYRLLPLDQMPDPPADVLGRISGGAAPSGGRFQVLEVN